MADCFQPKERRYLQETMAEEVLMAVVRAVPSMQETAEVGPMMTPLDWMAALG